MESTDEEIERFQEGFAQIDMLEESDTTFIAQNEEMTGRDADPPRTKPKPRRKILRPALIAASIAIALFVTNTITVYATGFNIFVHLARWTQGTVSFTTGEPGEIDKERDSAYNRLINILDVLDIRVDIPRHITDGFEFFSIEPDEPTEYSDIVAWFVRGNEAFYIRVKKIDATSSFSEINDEEQSEVYKGQFLITSNMHRTVAIWHQGIHELRIQGDLTHEELKQILDSI
jgi:hypothetical protein